MDSVTGISLIVPHISQEGKFIFAYVDAYARSVEREERYIPKYFVVETPRRGISTMNVQISSVSGGSTFFLAEIGDCFRWMAVRSF